MEAIKARAAKLIDVKSIVTLCLTLVFCVLSVIGVVPQEFLAIYTMIIGFYFGTQATKKADTAEAKPATTKGETLPVGTGTVIATPTVDPAMGNDVHPPDQTAVIE